MMDGPFTITENCGEAEDAARALAAFHGEAFTVWRRGDRFIAVTEHVDPEPFIPGEGPVRPVETIDPRGVVHA